MSEQVQLILTHLLAGVAGGLIGVFVAHLLTKSRDRWKDSSTRIADFVTFLRKWEEQVRAYPLKAFQFHSAYQDSWSNLKEAASQMEPCFTAKKNVIFRNRVDDACRICERNLPGNVGEVKIAKERIFEAICALESFAKHYGHGRWFML